METNYKYINYLNKKVEIIQYLSESDSQFEKRKEYIKLLEKENVDWKKTLNLSKFWYCIKFKKCRYTPEIFNMVLSYEKKNKL